METHVDTTDLVALGHYLKKAGKPQLVRGAMSSAMNRALTSTKKESKNMIMDEYAVKSKYVGKTLTLKRASKASPQAELISKGPNIPLSHFPHTPTRVTKTRKPVKVQVRKSGGKVQIQHSPKAFVGKTKNGKKHIFVRRGSKRLPIKFLTALAVPKMMENDKVMSRIQKHAYTKYEERIAHELDHRLATISKRSKGRR